MALKPHIKHTIVYLKVNIFCEPTQHIILGTLGMEA